MENESVLEKIAQADMVLAGFGAEFDIADRIRHTEGYAAGCETLKEAGLRWLIPGWNEFCTERENDQTLDRAVDKIAALLEGKNFFGVSVAVNRKLAGLERVVMPCGSTLKKQCFSGCADILPEVTQADREKLKEIFGELARGRLLEREFLQLGTCPECGAPLILNNVYAENYNEAGYLEQWKLYTKWLQGTLNRRLLILELGADMRFPSVIRWPFEKVAYFNRKAYFCRVNGKLYQLTKELAEKGCGISKNAVDWLEQL